MLLAGFYFVASDVGFALIALRFEWNENSAWIN